MKRPSFFVPLLPILTFVMAALFVGCDRQPLEPVPDEALTPLNKPVVNSYWWNMDWDEWTYEDCATGDDMQNHGWIKIYTRETITPSGNVIITGWVDYNAGEGVTLVNLRTGDIWTLTNGHNPFHEVIKENGLYILRYNWNELYKLNGQNLHIHLKGHFRMLPDGTVTHERESYTCG